MSPSGNDGNSGLSGFPKKTIQAAVNTAISSKVISKKVVTENEGTRINLSLGDVPRSVYFI